MSCSAGLERDQALALERDKLALNLSQEAEGAADHAQVAVT